MDNDISSGFIPESFNVSNLLKIKIILQIN